MDALRFQPLVILGAARSGTNMLRDALTRLPGFGTWPCDEINPIWRHGNLFWPDDEIPPERAGRARAYIRRAFIRMARRTGARVLVEKTCANTLRVPFVASVLPEARFVHILRDGRDVVASAARRWRGEMELRKLPYLAAKARYAPAIDLPVYGAMALRNRLAQRRGGRARIWGPRFSGMAEMAASGAPLEELCAAQWARSVTLTETALAALPSDRQLTLRYENVVADPRPALADIARLVGETPADRALADAAEAISASSVGKGSSISVPAMAPLLARLGYAEAP